MGKFLNCLPTTRPYFDFRIITLVKVNGVCYLPATHLYFSFRTITSKSRLGFTKFDMCIDIVEIWFGIAHWRISSIFIVICPRHDNDWVLSFHVFIFSAKATRQTEREREREKERERILLLHIRA